MRARFSSLFFSLLFLTLPMVIQARVELGIDVLQDDDYSLLRGKRVGLITNQTGVNSDGVKTRLLLRRAAGIKLVALFTPEHGLDGTERAGRYVSSRKDRLTGLTAYSLYGPTRKPTPEMLRGIDVLVYDLQDIGCRSYTYISTMVKCMEAAGEQNIKFVVLDRPNPLGGDRIEGPPMDPKWVSFVGQIPVPYVHGMTAGELARMTLSQGWLTHTCDLSVVRMRGWSRDMTWPETGLRWVQTSPNVPRSMSPFYYVATGLIGELAGLEVGCDGPSPFEIIAAKNASPERFTRRMLSEHFPGVTFSETQVGGFGGARLRIDPHADANLTALNVYFLDEFNRQLGNNLISRSRGDHLEMFYKCYGSSSIGEQASRGVSPDRIVAGWRSYDERFASSRRPYLLYP
ncbi:MAG: DUF1343 domain-containing protein [Chthoniobacteraceae bacterium]